MTKTKPQIGHLLGTQGLAENDVRTILDLAKSIKKAGTHTSTESSGEQWLRGKTVANLFFEDSTRTRNSFELASRKLGASVLNFGASSSSLSKGETLIDTVRTIAAMKPHCLVVRHSCAGSPHFLASQLNLPVVNAGDGFHEHPTQGLLDVLTMEEHLGTVRGKHVLIMGDIAHSRVARSNIYLLRTLGATVSICGPPTLMPPSPQALGVEFSFRPETLLPKADVVMTLRIQFERQNSAQIPSISEYQRFWGLNQERARLLKPSAIIMHPGPMNRGVELDAEVADGPRSVILDQVSNGVVIRMAVLGLVVAPEEAMAWKKTR